MATRIDHKFALTRWGWINTLFIAFIIIVAWKPIWETLGKFAMAVSGLFTGAAK